VQTKQQKRRTKKPRNKENIKRSVPTQKTKRTIKDNDNQQEKSNTT
jgi:hypothetical protein